MEATPLSPHSTPDPLEGDACYLALRTRDARFDGRFFTAVTSTGIYCRPVCGVRTPKRENCRFYTHAAQAELAGFRPCLRCRPELAPHSLHWSTQDASRILAQQAARLLDEPDAWPDEPPTVEALAARMGVSDRHLRRIFMAEFGVSPMQYLQTRRLLTAKQLLADTQLPVAQVALSSGYASVRRFNDAFAAHYRLSPTQLRRQGGSPAEHNLASSNIKLAYRPPFDAAAMLAFFRTRLVSGIEWIAPVGEALPAALQMARTLRVQAAGAEHTGWIEVEFEPAQHRVVLRVSDGLGAVLPHVIRRVRAWLDLDADPEAIHAVLGTRFPNGLGQRVPGSMDGFELAVRAVLGQQITVAAARTLAQRLVNRLGTPIATARPELNRLFPTPAAITSLGDTAGDALGQLGIVRQRQAAIIALAQAVASQQLALFPGAPVEPTVQALKALPGIGDWTAQYIAMRALRWPDAFPAGDVALQNALGVRGERQPARAAEEASAAWRPWRSYAVLCAWAELPQVAAKAKRTSKTVAALADTENVGEPNHD